MASASHKYIVGQKVGFLPGSGSLSHLRGNCTIVRLLPSENRDWQYRVKCDHDAHERVVLESQLAATTVTSSRLDPWAVRTIKTA
jgi:hypothetical protein